MISNKKYYSVVCKCGHTGSRMNYIPINFPICANNGKEAAAIGRNMPRCKHHHKDCILSVTEISYDEYKKLMVKNNEDPYLQCHSIQEQKQFDLFDRFVFDPHYDSDDEFELEEQKQKTFYGKILIKKPKRFIKNYYLKEAFGY